MKENRKKAPEGMYSAQEAIAVIGIPPSAFYGLVNAGDIKRVMLPARKEGFYAQHEINSYARMRQAYSTPYTGEKLDFVPAFNEDLQAIHDLVASVSGGEKHAVPVDVLKGWIRRNPQSVYILRKKNEIKGYVSQFPLKHDTLMQRLNGQLLNREIPFDEILPFRSDHGAPLYIAEMAVEHSPDCLINNEPDPSKIDPIASKLGPELIRKTFRLLVTLKHEGTAMTDLYAVGTSHYGIELCRNLGMDVMDLPTGVREHRKPFHAEVSEKSLSPLIRKLARA